MPASPDEIVADEARRRRLAALAAVAGAILTFAASLVNAVILNDVPRVQVLDALQEHIPAGGPPPSRKIQEALYFDDKGLDLIGGGVLAALGAMAIAYALTVLFRATRDRKPDLPRLAIIMVMTGAVAITVGGLVRYGALYAEAHSFAGDAQQTASGARDVVRAPTYIAGQFIEFLGRVALGIAIIVGSLNAMKIGLLTRFVGTLGVIAGALFIIPLLAGGQPIVLVLWLAMLAAILAGQWPNGVPPAWEQGAAIPWPTQQELREQRDGAGGEKPRAGKPREDVETGPPVAADATRTKASVKRHSSSKKRKRKR